MIYEEILKDYEYSVKISNKNRTVVILKSNDRVALQKKFLESLQVSYRIEKTSFSSFYSVVVEIPIPLIVVFKNTKGMAQTTLNSTITELAPCLAFSNKLNPDSEEELYEICNKVSKTADVYVCVEDNTAGTKFVGQFKESDKFDEKIKNALAVTKYLFNMNDKNKIDDIKWGYRKKPDGIENNHKGDIFVKSNNTWQGISLKAGLTDSKEPQLNTYVKPILDYFDKTPDYLIENLWDSVYSKIGCNRDYTHKSNKKKTLDILANLEINDSSMYDYYYVVSLGIIREHLINTMKSSKSTTKKWILHNICSKYETPLITLKIVGDKVFELEDSDKIFDALQVQSTINFSIDENSRQNFEIIVGDKPNIRMKMTVRSNKCGVEHKLGQFYNMSVKFNGTEN